MRNANGLARLGRRQDNIDQPSVSRGATACLRLIELIEFVDLVAECVDMRRLGSGMRHAFRCALRPTKTLTASATLKSTRRLQAVLNTPLSSKRWHERSVVSSLPVAFLFGLAMLFVQTGCGPAVAPMSDSKKAKELLMSMLEEWKSGASMEGLRNRTPPIYVTEDLWRGNSKLEEYSLTGDGDTLGSNIRFQVNLKCTNKSGKPVERSVRYIVTTQPALTIVREEG